MNGLHTDLALTLKAITQHGLTTGCGAHAAEAAATFVYATKKVCFYSVFVLVEDQRHYGTRFKALDYQIFLYYRE